MTLTPSASRLLALLLLLAVAAGAYFGAVVPAVDRYDAHVRAIDDLRFQAARYERILAERPALEARLAEVQADDSMGEHLLGGASAQLAAADLQERLKKTVLASGGRFVSAQAIAGEDEGVLEEIRIALKLDADIAALKAILHAIESDKIVMIVDRLGIRAKDDRVDGKLGESQAVVLAVDLLVTGFRERTGT